LKLTDKDKKNAAKSNCLCGYPTSTSGTSGYYNHTLAPESQGLLLQGYSLLFYPEEEISQGQFYSGLPIKLFFAVRQEQLKSACQYDLNGL